MIMTPLARCIQLSNDHEFSRLTTHQQMQTTRGVVNECNWRSGEYCTIDSIQAIWLTN